MKEELEFETIEVDLSPELDRHLTRLHTLTQVPKDQILSLLVVIGLEKEGLLSESQEKAKRKLVEDAFDSGYDYAIEVAEQDGHKVPNPSTWDIESQEQSRSNIVEQILARNKTPSNFQA